MLALCASLFAVAGCRDGRDSGDRDAGDAADASDADVGADALHDVGFDAEPDADAADTAEVLDTPEVDIPDAGPREGAIVSVAPRRVNAGTTLVYVVATEPADLELELLEAPEPARLDDDRSIVWEVSSEAFGESQFRVAALDGDEYVAEQAFAVLVNTAPTFTDAPTPVTFVEEPWRFDPQPFDLEGDAVTLELVDGPEWMTFDGAVAEGTPPSAGEFRFSIRASDPDAMSTEMEWTVRAVARLRELRADRAWMSSEGGRLDIFGCCFDDGVPEVSFGASAALEVALINTGRITVTFGALPPGQQPVFLSFDGVAAGALPEDLLVVPAVEVIDGELRVRGLLEPDDVAAREALSRRPLPATVHPGSGELTLELGDEGLLQVESGGIGSLPVQFGGGQLVVVAVEPPVHEAGSSGGATLTITGLTIDDELPRVHWGHVEATCLILDAGVCRVNVPFGAVGVPTVTVDGVPLPRIVGARAVEEPGDPSLTPELVWANRSWLQRGRESLVLIRGSGFENPSLAVDTVGGEARVVWAEGEEAVLAVLATSAVVTVELAIGGERSSPLVLFATAAPELFPEARSLAVMADGEPMRLEGESVVRGPQVFDCEHCPADARLLGAADPPRLWSATERALYTADELGTFTPIATDPETTEPLRLVGAGVDLAYFTSDGADLWAWAHSGAARQVAAVVVDGEAVRELARSDLSGGETLETAPFRFEGVADATFRLGEPEGSLSILAAGEDGVVRRIDPDGTVEALPRAESACLHATSPDAWVGVIGTLSAEQVLVRDEDGAVWVVSTEVGRAWACPTGLGGPGDAPTTGRFGAGARVGWQYGRLIFERSDSLGGAVF